MGEKLQDDIERVRADLEESKAAPSRNEVKTVAKKVAKKVVKESAKKDDGAPRKIKKTRQETSAADEEDDLVSVAALAEEAAISPQSARVKLRAASLERGDGRWKWKPDSKGLRDARKILGLPPA